MRQTLRLIWQSDKKRFVLKLFYTVCNSLLPLVGLVVLKALVDAVGTVVSGSGTMVGVMQETIVPVILLFCLVSLVNRLIGTLGEVNNDVLTQKLVDHINSLIQSQSVRLDMSYYDNPHYHDTFHRAQQEAAFRPVRMMESMVAIFGSMLSIAGVAVMLMTVSWRIIAVMVVAILPTFLVRLVKARRIYNYRRLTTQLARRGNYYGALLTGRAYAKEVRAFGLADHFRKLYVDIRLQLVERLMGISRRLALFDSVTAVVEAAAMGVVILFMVRPVASGAVTLGAFVMAFEAFRRGQGYLASLVSGVSGVYEHKLFINNLFDFLRLEPSIVSPEHPQPFPERVEEVRFNDITFAYPGMSHPVLSHFSLVARRGQITRIEGENGYGKTTMLKLLLRLYDPDAGSVTINGTDIRNFDLADLRRGVSAIFQDYVQFYFTLRENVTFGDISNASDARRVAQAISMADAGKVVDSLSDGPDTLLGRQFEGGEELSMGQWQRVALARQLFSQAQILAFDEPTAWMDSEACHHFEETLAILSADHLVLLIAHKD